MTDLSKATPRPWHIDPDPDAHDQFIRGANDAIIADCALPDDVTEGEANAALIVRAVNERDELIEARQAEACISVYAPQSGGLDIVRAALAKAGSMEQPKKEEP